jgi:hypothetical protein
MNPPIDPTRPNLIDINVLHTILLKRILQGQNLLPSWRESSIIPQTLLNRHNLQPRFQLMTSLSGISLQNSQYQLKAKLMLLRPHQSSHLPNLQNNLVASPLLKSSLHLLISTSLSVRNAIQSLVKSSTIMALPLRKNATEQAPFLLLHHLRHHLNQSNLPLTISLIWLNLSPPHHQSPPSLFPQSHIKYSHQSHTQYPQPQSPEYTLTPQYTTSSHLTSPPHAL